LLKEKRLGFIGGGNMAEAIIKGLLRAQLINSSSVMVSDIVEERLRYLQRSYGVQVTEDNEEVVAKGDILILAIKPQNMAEVLEKIKSAIDNNKLLISIAAGVPLQFIGGYLSPEARLVRVMPNAPALVLEGMAAIAPGKRATTTDCQIVEGIFNAIGKSCIVKEELLDVVTGLSGSGPAYIFVIIQALADGGVREGLPRDVALQLAAQTVLGAARMVVETGEHPEKLKDMVASPGGTTIAGLHQIELGNIRATLINAVIAATERSRELGQNVIRSLGH